MVLEILPYALTVCKPASAAEIGLDTEICFVGKTDEELSLVCKTEDTPAHTTAREDGWRAFRIRGTLDFSLIGILSKISTALADAHIGIFVVSTYNTDYILIKANDLDRASSVLAAEGYDVI